MDEVYNELMVAFLLNVSADNKVTLREKYLEYLHKSYDSYFNNANEGDMNSIAAFCVKREKITHLDISEDAKMAFLNPDENYSELERVAFEIAHIANKKKKDGILDVHMDLDEYIRLLETLNSKISKRFRFSADRVYSDAIVDLKYIFEDESIESLRLQ